MGMDALRKLIESPRVITGLVKASKVTALRLDIHPETGVLVATVAHAGQIYQREVPVGVTLNQADMIELVQGPAPAEISAAPPPDTP